jgi:hypothetical protein
MFRIKSTIMESRPFDVLRDDWRVMQRAGMSEVGNHWFKEMLPQHFVAGAERKYNHRPRSAKYLAAKKNMAKRGRVKLGGVVDNVFSGAAMEAIMGRAVIRGFPTRATVYMYGPDYLKINFRRSSNQPNKKREILTTIPSEAEILKGILRKFMESQLETYRGRVKTTTV